MRKRNPTGLPGMVPLTILRVSAGPPGGEPFAILGERGGARFLAAPLCPTDAISLVMHMERIDAPEPLTHDLFAAMFEEAGFIADRIEVIPRDTIPRDTVPREAAEQELEARLFYRAGSSLRVRTLRVTDALALAPRLGAPLYADERLVRMASPRVILRQSA